MQNYIKLVKVYLDKLKAGPNVIDYLTGTRDKDTFYSPNEINCVEKYVSYLENPQWVPPSPTGISFGGADGMPGKPPKIEPFNCEQQKRFTAEIVRKAGLNVLTPLKKMYDDNDDSKQKKLMKNHELNVERQNLLYPKDPAAIAAKLMDENHRAQHKCTKEILEHYGLIKANQ